MSDAHLDDPKRFWRYLAPNAITALSLLFGLGSIWSAHAGRWDWAGWLIVYACLSDRLDGFVARSVKGTSELGVQLDSFADFLNFGVAPAWLCFSFLEFMQPVFQYSEAARWFIGASCALWVMSAVFRLARYNIQSDESAPTKIFFGIPTTLAGGLFAVWFLAMLKYQMPMIVEFGGKKLLPASWSASRSEWFAMAVAMLVGAFLMSSSLKMLKMGRAKSRWKTLIIAVCVILCAVGSFTQMFPELVLVPPTAWIIIFLIWGQFVPEVRALRPPPLFPRSTDKQPHTRSQDDLDDDEE